MANRKDFMELAEIASGAINEVERLQKSAALDSGRLEQVSHTLVDCGVISSEQRDTFVKLASENPNKLLNAVEAMAKHAKFNSSVSTSGVGTVVKVADSSLKKDDCDRAFRELYSGRY